jgi:DNA-directed RNA polymerase sigma subunit (sigma70/sigma32)
VALVARLRGCLGSITPRQQEALLLRTGLNGRPAYTPGRVARILHVSARRENQIEQAAVASLRSSNAHTSCGMVSKPGSAIAHWWTRR